MAALITKFGSQSVADPAIWANEFTFMPAFTAKPCALAILKPALWAFMLNALRPGREEKERSLKKVL